MIRNISGLVSIIMPVHNVEKYLESSLSSIIYQDVNTWELLLVDDGSTDHSGSICDKYAEIDDRIHVFHIANKGVSHARNVGILHSKGEFIVFCDSDDLVAPDYISSLKNKIVETKSDIVRCGRNFIDELTMQYKKGVCSYDWLLYTKDRFVTLNEYMYHVVWGKIYRKSIIINNKILFDERLNRGEDTLFSYMTVLCSNRILYSDNEYVNYRIRNNSLMRSVPSVSLYEQNVCKYYYLCKFAEHKDFDQNLLNQFQFMCMQSILDSILTDIPNEDTFKSDYIQFSRDKNIQKAMLRATGKMNKKKQLAVLIMTFIKKTEFSNIVRFILKHLIK